MNKFDLILKKFAEAIAQGGDRDDVEAQVLAFAKRQGYGDFNSIEELERAGMEGIERDLDASETRLGNVGRSLAQGLTMGFSDELAGLGAALAPGGRDYQEGRQEALARLERGRRENPYASFAGEMAGAVAPGIGAMRAASMIPQIGRALRSPRLMPRLRTGGLPQPGRAAAMAGLGAAEGAVYGLGAGESGLQDRLESAETGAKFGGAIGGALPFVPLVGGALRTRGARGGTVQETVQEGIERVRPREMDLGPARIERRSPLGLLDSAQKQLEPVRNRRVQTRDKLRKGIKEAKNAYNDFHDSHRLGWSAEKGDANSIESANKRVIAWLNKHLTADNLGSGWREKPRLETAVIEIQKALNPEQGLIKNLPSREMDVIRRHFEVRANQKLGRSKEISDELTNLLDDLYGPQWKQVRSGYAESHFRSEAYNAGAGKKNSYTPIVKYNFQTDDLVRKQDLEDALDEILNDPRITSLPEALQGARRSQIKSQFLEGVWDRFSKDLENSARSDGTKAGITKLRNLTRGEGREWFRQFFEEGRSGDRKMREAIAIIEDATPFSVKHKNLYNVMRLAAIFGVGRAVFASGESGLLGAIDPF
jgi:hypothetical protein